MQEDYKIEDLTFQSTDTVTYRARKKNGRPHTLTRLNLPEKILTPLQDGEFRLAYARLLDLNHGCLRAVADGGLDPIDQVPWVATKWWEGKLLTDQIKQKTLTGADIARIRFHGETLIHDLGHVAGALSFDPRTIVTTRSLEGEKVTTFEISYARWFTDWARGITPGAGDDPYDNLNNLISKLEDEIEEFEDQPSPSQNLAAKNEPATVPVLQPATTQPALITPPAESSTATQPTPSPVADPVSALSATTAPTSGMLLASAGGKKSASPKKLAFIGTAVATIIVSAFILSNQGANASSKDDSASKEEAPIKAQTKPTPDKRIAEEKPKSTPDTPSKPRKKSKGLPKRPEFSGEMLDIDSDNEKDLAENVGDWVVIRGSISKIDDKGAIHFKDSPLQGFLLNGSAAKAVGSKVQVTGILTSKKTLRIEKKSDISGLQSKQTIYTLKDESLLRTMEDQRVTVKAHVKGYTESDSGNTLYLVFNEEGPGFRAGISPQKTGSSTNKEYLRQFIYKDVLVTGRVSTFEKAKGNQGKRLVIRFRNRADVKLAK